MSFNTAFFGLIATFAALVVLVAQLRLEPMYSLLIRPLPSLRQLRAAREALDERRPVKISDEEKILNTIHQVAAEEYDQINDRYTPIEFKWYHQGFSVRYAEGREQIVKNTPEVQNEMVGYCDERISKRLYYISVFLFVIAGLGYLVTIVR